MKNRSVQHTFAEIPKVDIQRSRFDRSFRHLTTFDAGLLIPFFADEVLPGDTFQLKVRMLIRLATPIVPFMDNLFVDTHFFFVPNRLIWDNFEKFMGAQANPGDSTDYLVPQVTGTNVQNLTLWDYLGLPTNVPNALTVDSLVFRAYNLIWNEWFRDENLQQSVAVPKGDGPDNLSDFNLLRRGKRRDYFTSALPWPQKGPAVSVGLSGDAPVYSTESPDNTGTVMYYVDSDGSSVFRSYARISAGASVGSGSRANYMQITPQDGRAFTGNETPLYFPNDGNGNVFADLSQVNAVNINNLRQAFQIQKFLERNARGGTRYVEYLKNHFGVTSPDARLQRPEYLGGGTSRIHINAVPQTSSSTDTSPQGNLSAFGVMGDEYHGFTKSFVEHGILIGLISVRAPLTYQQGINRMFLRRDLYDFYDPAFAHLGEQTIEQREIFAQGTADDEIVFGYQERYGEYRYKPDMVTGKFRSTDPQSLDVWHLAQEFSAAPKLNSEFIQENPPVQRVIAVQNEPQFLADTVFCLKCVRPMPVYSVPGLVDHF